MMRRNLSGDVRRPFEKAVECLDTPSSEPGKRTRESELTAAEISWGIGDARFRAEPVSQHSPIAEHAVCLNCRREFTADTRIVTFYAEGEPVAYV